MTKPRLIVIAKSDDPYLSMLDALRDQAFTTIGSRFEDLAGALPDAQALLAWNVDRELIERILPAAPNLRWVHSRWAGLDALLFPELVESSVVITNAKGVYSQSLGEFAIMGALFFAKDVRRLLRAQANHKWEPFVMQEIRGATMGVVGYGDIGRSCAQRAHALGMRVLAMRRRPEQSQGDEIVDRAYGRDGLIDMIRESDYLVAAAPLTPDTRSMISEREIAAMKPNAVLMNVGRGPVIDEPALIRALREGKIRGAALDVFTSEPLPPGHPLFEFDNVLLSPHCADNTPTWNTDSMRFFLRNFERFAKGEPLENVVDKHAGY